MLDDADEAVAALGKGLDEPRLLVIVAERSSQLLDSGVEAVIEIHKSVAGPKPFHELLAGDDFAGMLQEQGKHLKGQHLESYFAARFVEFTGSKINLKNVKACDKGGTARRRHTNLCWSNEYNTPSEIHGWGRPRH